MKKTVLYENIDGFDIIVGFDAPVIDPVETAKVVNAALIDTPEYKASHAKKAEYAKAVEDRNTAKKNKDNAAYKLALSAMDVRQEELKPLARDLDDKITALRHTKAVYFEPRAGELIKDASEVDKLIEAAMSALDGTLIALDGTKVHNNRGKVYFRKAAGKWMRTEIVKLGDEIPKDAVLEADATDKQRIEFEQDRVAALTPAARDAEREVEMEKLLNESSSMRSRLEIQAYPDALAKTQKWYKAEKKKIDALYG